MFSSLGPRSIHPNFPTGPTGKSGPPQNVDQFFRNFSGWTEPIHWVLDRNFRKFLAEWIAPMICETFEPCDVVQRLGHFDGIVPSLACILTKQHGVRGGKYHLKIPGNGISETLLYFKMSLDASALNSSE